MVDRKNKKEKNIENVKINNGGKVNEGNIQDEMERDKVGKEKEKVSNGNI